jgi:hypothetical protein
LGLSPQWSSSQRAAGAAARAAARVARAERAETTVCDGITMPKEYMMNRRMTSFLLLFSKTFFQEKA